jgi:trans-2,3-dihydro-3-hydroxyanthranilate isomerase
MRRTGRQPRPAVPEPDGTYRLQIDQGVAMGRPSMLEGTACKQDGRLNEVVVSGRAAILGNGTVTLPPE